MDRKARKEEIIKMNFPRLCVVKNNSGACGLTVLAAMARYYGKQFTPEQFSYLYNLSNATPGLDGDMIPKYMKVLGIKVEKRTDCTPEDIKKAISDGIPCAVAFSPQEDSHGHLNAWGGNHIAAIVGVGKKYIYLADNCFCDGQVVDWRLLKRFEERWFETDCIGYPDHIPSPADNIFGTLILFHGDKIARDFESIWNKTPLLRHRYRKELSKRWNKRQRESVIRICESTERYGERRDREVVAMGGWSAHREWLKSKWAEEGYVAPDELDDPETIELPPEYKPSLEQDERNRMYDEYLDALSKLKPKDYYKFYLRGVLLPMPPAAL